MWRCLFRNLTEIATWKRVAALQENNRIDSKTGYSYLCSSFSRICVNNHHWLTEKYTMSVFSVYAGGECGNPSWRSAFWLSACLQLTLYITKRETYPNSMLFTTNPTRVPFSEWPASSAWLCSGNENLSTTWIVFMFEVVWTFPVSENTNQGMNPCSLALSARYMKTEHWITVCFCR